MAPAAVAPAGRVVPVALVSLAVPLRLAPWAVMVGMAGTAPWVVSVGSVVESLRPEREPSGLVWAAMVAPAALAPVGRVVPVALLSLAVPFRLARWAVMVGKAGTAPPVASVGSVVESLRPEGEPSRVAWVATGGAGGRAPATSVGRVVAVAPLYL